MPRVEFIQGNDLHLLRSGAEYFPALLQAINEARNEIYLETYIFQPDETGFRIQQGLIQAAQRGVSVRVVIDWLGSGREHAEQLCLILLREGVACRLFNPWFRRGLARTHRKITVCDGQVAFVGGLNIIDDLISDDGSGIRLPFPRWDFALRILGPLVPVIHSEVDAQWRKAGAMDLRSRFGLLRSLRQEARLASQQTGLAALLVRDNLRNRSSIQKAFLQALGRAKQRAVLVTPYFAPGRKFRRAMTMAAQRGVEVVLLVGVGQFRLQDAVTQAYYPRLLKRGVRIVEYHRTQLHAKVAIVDHDWASVGSSNFDGLSLFLNHESNIVVRDHRLTAEIDKELREGIAQGREIRLTDYDQIPWWRRVYNGFAYILYRALMRIITLGYYG